MDGDAIAQAPEDPISEAAPPALPVMTAPFENRAKIPISDEDLHLFRFVETAEDAWAAIAPEVTG